MLFAISSMSDDWQLAPFYGRIYGAEVSVERSKRGMIPESKLFYYFQREPAGISYAKNSMP